MYPRLSLRARSSSAALLRATLAALCATALPACASSSPRHPEHPARPVEAALEAQKDDAPLEIDNRNWSDVIVLLIRNDGQRTRIGTVGAASRTIITLPANAIAGSATIQLVAHPIGGWGEYLSPRFTVLPGQQVYWTLESGLERSSLSVQ
ncbi:MAG TPA: hypothetical protein VFS05_03775 [Gemmatimonadaceae bacterium]|nr:hypothetical protein [Gemmatimonadaceae bacterium]